MQNYDQAKEKALQISKTPEGQNLLKILLQAGGNDMETAMEKAAAGDFSQVQQTLSRLMENPEIRKLLENMGW